MAPALLCLPTNAAMEERMILFIMLITVAVALSAMAAHQLTPMKG